MTVVVAGPRSAAAALLVGALSFAAPAAVAEGPIRTVDGPREFVIPAGEGCPDFDVHVQGIHHTRLATKEFADGRFVANTSATIRMTNMETGHTFVQRSRYMELDLIDPGSGDLLIEVHGRQFVTFWPGDVGPDGSIVSENMMLTIVGHQTIRLDLDTFAYEEYRLRGRVAADICAELAE